MTKTNTSHEATCQICERTCKLDKSGNTSLHGYTRPGHGFINGRCRGAQKQPWEVSCEALRGWIIELGEILASRKAALVSFDASETVTWEVPRMGADGGLVYINNRVQYVIEMIGPSHAYYDQRRKSLRTKATNEIETIENEITRQSARLAGWKAAA